ncbi:GNAT family N-acetyltransferase [Pilimelia anulata]|nr:GNAT family N-acetyltransferase [Pilimelia anulata]
MTAPEAARDAAGKGPGAIMLEWAGDEIRSWGRRWLRIDVHRHNHDLQRYYERLGFAKVAELTAPDPSVPGRTRGSGTLARCWIRWIASTCSSPWPCR